MEKFLKEELKMSQKSKMLLIFGFVLFCSLSFYVFGQLYINVRDIIQSQAVSSIVNISALNMDSVRQTIEVRQTLMEILASRLEGKQLEKTDAILMELETFVEPYGFRRMGFLRRQDDKLILYLTSGAVLDATGVLQYETAWSQTPHLSDSYMPLEGGPRAVNLFSHPVLDERGEVRCVVVGLYPSWRMVGRMNLSAIKGRSQSFLLDTQETPVVNLKLYEDKTYLDMLQYVRNTSELFPNSKKDTYFEYKNEKWYACYEPLGVNDWYLMTCAPKKDVFVAADSVLRHTLIGLGILWGMAVASIILTAIAMYRSKRLLIQVGFYDSLTGVGNGSMLPPMFRHMSEQEADELYMVIFNIDKFKEFNYLYGEERGNDLLCYIVQVFSEELPGDYVLRYLSDHYVALVHAPCEEEIQKKIEHILTCFDRDIIAGIVPPFDISAGVRKVQKDKGFRQLMSDALTAKGTIKGFHIQQYAFYDETIRKQRVRDLEMESDFARALREREFHVYYQPKYDMTTGEIVGAEALVRWIKADGTILSPGVFIPCFEASRQIIFLDEAVLEEVCRQMKEMEAMGLPIKRIAINLSRVHLRHRGILGKIQKIIRESGVSPNKLAFEITESALYEDTDRMRYVVDCLHEMGCKVDMDDYGVGMSGANALAANRFDLVKLDKSFIDSIGDSRTDEVIRSTITLSKALGMEILAEGVEQKYQADILVSWGCTLAQGFYYSPPIPQAEYRQLLMKDLARNEKS